MMNALREYNEMVMKPAWKWVEKHWKGYSVFLLICMTVPYIYLYWNDIRRFIKSKFKKNKEES